MSKDRPIPWIKIVLNLAKLDQIKTTSNAQCAIAFLYTPDHGKPKESSFTV